MIVLLNGAPCAGKTTLARALVEAAPGDWLHFGGDAVIAGLPERLRPGLGLRPDAGREDLEPLVGHLYEGLFGALLAFDFAGVNVVADVGLHAAYTSELDPLGWWKTLADGRSAWLVSVRCGPEETARRRAARGWPYEPGTYERWEAVHAHDLADLTVWTDRVTPEEGAAAVLARVSSRA